MSQSEEYNQKDAYIFLRNISFVVLGLLISFFFVRPQQTIQYSSSKYDEIIDLIRNNYVDSIDVNSIEKGAISSLLENLDPHSVYIPEEDLKAANEPLVGNFSGVGIEFFIANDTLTVVTPIVGGPSELAGIKSGDKIIKIDDSIVAGIGLSNRDVFEKLRGKRGTEVNLDIMRNKKLLPKITIRRDKIKVNSVEEGIVIDSAVGYIKINTFGENTYSEFKSQLLKLKEQHSISDLIIDLRQNTGGYLEVAIAILDELIPRDSLLLYTEGLHYPREQYKSKKTGIFEKGKIAVIIDEGSASASEIIAGTIQDLDRGWVVGRRSFGKGLVQNQLMLSDGSAVRLTIAKYYTPSGRNIQKPYKNTAYHEDIVNRYEKGEFFNGDNDQMEDTVTFLTAHGRKVKGGGGISPDIFVSLDTNYDYINYSKLRVMVPDYVYSHHSMFTDLKSKYADIYSYEEQYKVSAQTMRDFYKYCTANDVKWSNSKKYTWEKRLKNLVKAYIAKQVYGTQAFIKINSLNDQNIQKSIKVFKNPKKYAIIPTPSSSEEISSP